MFARLIGVDQGAPESRTVCPCLDSGQLTAGALFPSVRLMKIFFSRQKAGEPSFFLSSSSGLSQDAHFFFFAACGRLDVIGGYFRVFFRCRSDRPFPSSSPLGPVVTVTPRDLLPPI